jgi:hypothetical protein
MHAVAILDLFFMVPPENGDVVDGPFTAR